MLQVTTATDSNGGIEGMCLPLSDPLRWNGLGQMRDEGLVLERTWLDDNQVSHPKARSRDLRISILFTFVMQNTRHTAELFVNHTPYKNHT